MKANLESTSLICVLIYSLIILSPSCKKSEIDLLSNKSIPTALTDESPSENSINTVSYYYGKVVDEAIGQPLVGALVLRKNSFVGVYTDTSGNFIIGVNTGSTGTFAISYIGYLSLEVPFTAADPTHNMGIISLTAAE